MEIKKIRWLVFLVIGLGALTGEVSLAFGQGGPPDLNLMPIPERLVRTDGVFRLTASFSTAGEGPSSSRVRGGASRMMSRLAGRTGLFFSRDFLSDQSLKETTALAYRCEREGRLEPGEDESYSLTIRPETILLEAKTDIGILRGFETLLQLLSADDQGYHFPCLTIIDKPRFTWRGLLIDAGRHFMPVEVIKRNLDAMAAVKMNVLHWHLTEDQGFRIESRTFPKLHQLGSDGLYYSQAQVKEIIDYAAARGIRVMPEFDIPGHSTSWFVAYPEFASAPGPYSVGRTFGVYDPAFNPADERVYRFFDQFFKEMAALFPDPYIHIGGDEVNGKHWSRNEAIQAFMKKNRLEDNHALQAYFNRRILKILTKHGKKMVGWDEIFQPGLPADIVIHSWRGQKALVEAAQKGYRGLLSNGYYIDLVQPTDFHYLNDPIAADSPLKPEEKRLVLGGEATMWAELVTPETIDSRIWPRTAAIAERLWSAQEIRDVEDMYRRLEATSLRLEELGLTHVKNQDMMLRRISGTNEIEPLRTLADVVEPVKIYARHSRQGMTYTTLSPLTRLVDAARPESLSARSFRAMTDLFLKTPDLEAAKDIESRLAGWRDNHARLLPLIGKSPVLKEIAPLSESLSSAAGIGLEALDLLRKGKRADAAWAADQLKKLEEAKKPKAELEIPLIPAVENLVKESQMRGEPSAPMKEYAVKKISQDFAFKDDAKVWAAIEPLVIKDYLWLDNGYTPKVEARVCYSDSFLYVFFKAYEKKIRAKRTEFQDPVYKDSCVEFFVDMFPEKKVGYLNFETNALGAMLVYIGKERGRRTPLTKEDVKGIVMSPSVKKPTDGPHGADFWTLKYKVPLALFEKLYGEKVRPGLEARANFYKCGDETEFPHYGAWNPVRSPKPNFHFPESFGKIIFQE